MIDFLRSIQPMLMWFIPLVLVVTIIYFVAKKHVPSEYAKYVKIGYQVILSIATLVFIISLIKFTAVNEVPKSTIEDSVIEERESYFEKEAKKTIKESKEKKDSIN